MKPILCGRCFDTKRILTVLGGEEYAGTEENFLRLEADISPCPNCSSEVVMAGGLASSSKCPPFHLIPTIGLARVAYRFEKGVEIKKEKAWNALSSNQACLKDKTFAIERISHIIDHATKLRDKLQADDVAAMAEDDDAAAIAWAGIFLCCVVDLILKEAEHESSS